MIATRYKASTDLAAASMPPVNLQTPNAIVGPPNNAMTSEIEDKRIAFLAGMIPTLEDPQHQASDPAGAAGAHDPFHTGVGVPTLLPIISSNTRTRRTSASASPEKEDGSPVARVGGIHDLVPASNGAPRVMSGVTQASPMLVPRPVSKVTQTAKNAGTSMKLQDNRAEIPDLAAEDPHAHSSAMQSTTLPKDPGEGFDVIGEWGNGVSPVLRKGTGAGFQAIISQKLPLLAAKKFYEAATPKMGQDVCYAMAQDLERRLNVRASSNADYRKQSSHEIAGLLEADDRGLGEMLGMEEKRMSQRAHEAKPPEGPGLAGVDGEDVGSKQTRTAKEDKRAASSMSDLPLSLPPATQSNVGTPPLPLTQPSSASSGSPALARIRSWLSARKNQADT